MLEHVGGARGARAARSKPHAYACVRQACLGDFTTHTAGERVHETDNLAAGGVNNFDLLETTQPGAAFGQVGGRNQG
jgi:hypothetical protein